MIVLPIILSILVLTSGTIYIGPLVISWTSLYCIIIKGMSPGFIGTRLGYIQYWLTEAQKLKDKEDNEINP